LITENIEIEFVPCDICLGNSPKLMFKENGFILNRCDHCGHFYVSPRPRFGSSHGSEEEIFSPSIHVSDELRRKAIFQRYVNYIKRYVPRGKWLDIGCGCGTLLKVASQSGFEVEGIEINPARLAYCRDAGLKAYGGDIEADLLPPSSYDVVSLINVFSHLRSPMTTFSSIHRILGDNGVILVATSELGKKAYKDEVENWHIPDHLHFAGPNTFQWIASKLNLKFSYVSRSLTQKVVLSEKLYYRSNHALVQLMKMMLQYIPGLINLTAGIMCLSKGYRRPRQEVVVLFQKRIDESSGFCFKDS
jgi:SAM-dependent methyltransferase